MAFISIPNVAIRGISACVPSHVEENIDLPVFKEGEASRVIAQTGIERKHTVESGTTASDLCVKAANKLLEDLGWGKDRRNCVRFIISRLCSPANSLYNTRRTGIARDLPFY